MPKNTTKVDTPSAGKEELKRMKEAQVLKDLKGEALFGKAKVFDFVPKSFVAN